jgi:nucleoside-diphosphate-sugar epimerase
MMLELAKQYPEYKDTAAKVKLVETTSTEYYGKGYQDVQNRVPNIDNTMKDLNWSPTVNMADALKGIFDHYRKELEVAKELVN